MDPLKAAVAVGKTGNGWKLVFPELLAAFGTVFTLDVHDRACRKSHARDKRGRKRGWKTLSLWAWFSRFDTHIHLVSLFIYMLHIINIYIYVYKCIYIYIYAVVRVLDAAAAVKAISLVQSPPLFELVGARARYPGVLHPHKCIHPHTCTITHGR